MKISSSMVGFNSQHETLVNETLNSQREEMVRQTSIGADGSPLGIGASVDLSYEARMRSGQSSHVNTSSVVKSADDTQTIATKHNTASLVETVLQHKLSIEKESGLNFAPLLQLEIEPVQLTESQALEYQDIQELSIGDLATASEALNVNITNVEALTFQPRFNVEEARVNIHEQRVYTEQEKLNVASQGVITTEDGREINFLMELEMAREFELEENFSSEFQSRTMIDPLVINLDGGAAGLSSGSFTFDLDADGTTEEISFARQGSGFLALDKNNDGQINDGSELFGTQGQNGFSDLAQYDADGNRWIDENDEIFNDLKVWSRDADGNDQLVSLKEAGVGAIYLGSTSSTFELKDDQNNSLGEVKRTGVFLMEDGAVGSIQELDLAIHGESADTPADAGLADRITEESAGFEEQAEATQSVQIRIGEPPSVSPEVRAEQAERMRASAEKLQETRVYAEASSEKVVQSSSKEDEPITLLQHLDASRLDMLERLHSKTEVQIEHEYERYDYLSDIIDRLKVQQEKADSRSLEINA